MISKNITLGILAHVDSGKTTLAESILYKTGVIKNIGRVDNKDTYLDTYELEKNRGITIFSKQANICIDDLIISILDTPGHVDFSAEMERTLQVLDYAILVISGVDGVQGHTQTLWRLLDRYKIPTFIFINKMDRTGMQKENIMKEINIKLDTNCINFNDEKKNKQVFYENVSLCDEDLMYSYINNMNISSEDISKRIKNRIIFPCYYGSALRVDGIDELLEGIKKYTIRKKYNDEFSGRVYKIGRDEKNNRLTYIKITGGKLKVKDVIEYESREGNRLEKINEKIDQIRIYSGYKFNTYSEVEAGTVCAVTGLSKTYVGQGIGNECEPEIPILIPVLSYNIIVQPEINVHEFFIKLKSLEEEQPEINLVWNETSNEISAQVMGEVQIEILKSIIWDRYQVKVEFGTGKIVYKETIEEEIIGIGHFEPLRHYAEVHLLIEPLERGSGLEFETNCSEDVCCDIT